MESRSAVSQAGFVLCLLPLLVVALLVAVEGPVPERPELLPALLGAGVVWLGVCLLAARGAGSAGVVVAGAIALRLLVFAGDPGLSDDVYRTVWEGEVVRSGASPYAYAPAAPELAELRAELPDLFARMNNVEVSAAYPPVTQAVGAGLVTAAELAGRRGVAAVPWVRAFYGLCDLLVLWPLLVLLRRAGRPDGLLAVWGWSPLVAFEFAGSGHFDSLGILLVVVTATCVGARGASVTGLLALTGSILVKLLPLGLLPFAVRGSGYRGWWRAALVVTLCGLAFLPLLALRGGFHGLERGVSEYGLRWESFNLVYRWIEPVFAALFERDGGSTDPRRLGRLLIGGLWVGWGVLAWRARVPFVAASATVIGAFLVLSPTLHPWYLTWMVPFLALAPRSLATVAWAWLLAGAVLLYTPLVGWHAEGVWREPVWLWPVLAVPFLGLRLAALAVRPAR